MITVTKPQRIPAKLRVEGSLLNQSNCDDYDNNNALYDLAGFKIDNKIYGHPTVKAVLKNAQKNKCCFCEKDQVDEFGNVEHYRPKKGYKINKKDKLSRPGYYWLAFTWDNLFFVCSACNSAKYKGNRFPLVDEARRAKNHNDNYLVEEPLLLHPAKSGLMNPQKHIGFNNEFPIGLSKFGKTTINVCGLDRDALNNKRKKLLEDIDARIAIISLQHLHSPATVMEAKRFLRNCQNKEAEFSSAASAYLAKFNIVVT